METNVREDGALVDEVRAVPTESQELLGVWPRTGGAFLPPAPAHRTAASLAAEQTSDIVGAEAGPVLQVARLHSLVDTAGAWVGDEKVTLYISVISQTCRTCQDLVVREIIRTMWTFSFPEESSVNPSGQLHVKLPSVLTQSPP